MVGALLFAPKTIKTFYILSKNTPDTQQAVDTHFGQSKYSLGTKITPNAINTPIKLNIKLSEHLSSSQTSVQLAIADMLV